MKNIASRPNRHSKPRNIYSAHVEYIYCMVQRWIDRTYDVEESISDIGLFRIENFCALIDKKMDDFYCKVRKQPEMGRRMERQLRGKQAEFIVMKWLKQNGYRITQEPDLNYYNIDDPRKRFHNSSDIIASIDGREEHISVKLSRHRYGGRTMKVDSSEEEEYEPQYGWLFDFADNISHYSWIFLTNYVPDNSIRIICRVEPHQLDGFYRMPFAEKLRDQKHAIIEEHLPQIVKG